MQFKVQINAVCYIIYNERNFAFFIKTNKAYLMTHFFSTLNDIGADDGTGEEEPADAADDEEPSGMNYNICVVLTNMVGQRTG